MPFLAPALKWGGRGLMGASLANDAGAFKEFGSPSPGEVSMLAGIDKQTPSGSMGFDTMMGRNMAQVFTDDIPMQWKSVDRLYQNLINKLPDKVGPVTNIREGARHLVGGSAQSKSAHAMKDVFRPKGKHYTVPGIKQSIFRGSTGAKWLNLIPRIMLGASKQVGFIPFNLALEGLDAIGASAEWMGGTGMGRPGLHSKRDYEKQIFTDSENPTIFGYPDPTPGALLDRAGTVVNFTSKPARSLNEIVYQLPQNIADIHRGNREEDARVFMAAEDEAMREQYPDLENRTADPEIYTEEPYHPTINEIVNPQSVGITNKDLWDQWRR